MSQERLSFSIIIPKRFGSEDLISQDIKRLNWPLHKLELIFVEGEHPAVQRNEGAKVAKGEILCFWDNDCQPSSEYFQRVSQIFEKDGNIVAGGPAIPRAKRFLHNIYAMVLQSYFVHYKMRARYTPVGNIRETDEKELIGCNLCVRREKFLELGGFNPALYPNEENEFLSRLKRKNLGKIIYSPDVIVYREMRDNFFFFIKRFYKYGKGRAKQILCDSLKLNFVFFLPCIFLLYILSLIFVRNSFYYFPLILYFCGGIVNSFKIAFKEKTPLSIFILPGMYFLIHISYALGFISSLIKHLLLGIGDDSVTNVRINIEKINSLR